MSNFVELNNNAMVKFGGAPAAVKFGGNPSVANPDFNPPAVKFASGFAVQSFKKPFDPKKASYIKANKKEGKMGKKKLRAMRPKVLYNPYDWMDYADIDEYMRGLNFKFPVVDMGALNPSSPLVTAEQLNPDWGDYGVDAADIAQVKHGEEPLNPDWDQYDGDDPKKTEVKSVFSRRFSEAESSVFRDPVVSVANKASEVYPAVKHQAQMNIGGPSMPEEPINDDWDAEY